jgi:serine/threonine protein kinase
MVLYHMLYGHPAFTAQTKAEYIQCHRKNPVRIPTSASPSVENILIRTLKKNYKSRLGIYDLIQAIDNPQVASSGNIDHFRELKELDNKVSFYLYMIIPIIIAVIILVLLMR